MHILLILLRLTEVLICLMLIGVILLQRSKGAGAGVSFGGGMGEAVFGAQMGDVLSKTTVILGILFLVNTIALSLMASRGGVTGGSDSLMSSETPTATVPAAAGNGQALPLAPEDATSDSFDLDMPLEGATTAGESASSVVAVPEASASENSTPTPPNNDQPVVPLTPGDAAAVPATP